MLTDELIIVNAGQVLTMTGVSKRGPRRGHDLSAIGLKKGNLAIFVRHGKIVQVGSWKQIRTLASPQARRFDVSGRVVMPGFVDSHTHALFGPARLVDFEERIRGSGYEEIAKKGGGISTTVEAVRAWPQEELKNRLAGWCRRALALGTTTMEIKTGYGLNLQAEEKMLNIISSLPTRLEIVSTFLGAHAIPKEFQGKTEKYLELVIRKMLPRFKRLARYCDVFCDRGYFSVDQARRLLGSAKKLGYGLKIHAEQLSRTGAAGLGVDLGAASVDHLDYADRRDFERLARSSTVATLLPGCSFYAGKGAYPAARAMIDSGVAVALASDFNPGSSPSLSMGFVLSLAVTQMKMTPQEAMAAATVNGACALGLGERLGVLEPGRQADLAVMDVHDWREIPYYFATNMVCGVIKKGAIIHEVNTVCS